MNAREQAHQISQAIVETQKKLHDLEVNTNYYPSRHDQIIRLKRVLRALDRDLDKIVATIPAPVQYDFFSTIEAHQSALEEQGKDALNEDRENSSTPRTIVRRSIRHYGARG